MPNTHLLAIKLNLQEIYFTQMLHILFSKIVISRSFIEKTQHFQISLNNISDTFLKQSNVLELKFAKVIIFLQTSFSVMFYSIIYWHYHKNECEYEVLVISFTFVTYGIWVFGIWTQPRRHRV